MPSAARLEVRGKDKSTLRSWVRASGIRAGLAQRARIVLLAGEGHSNTEIATRVGVSRPTVIHWRDRYREGGLAALQDRKRSGSAAAGRPGAGGGGDVDPAAAAARGDALVEPAAGRRAGRRASRRWRGSGGTGTCSPGGSRRSSSPPTPSSRPRSATSSGCICTRRRTPWCSASTRNRVRHEALMKPCGMEGPPPVVVATGRSWRQIDPRVRGEVGSSLDNVGASRNYQTVRARERGRKGVGRPNQW